MLQMKELDPMLQRLNDEQIHTIVETSLFCSSVQLSIAIKHIDLFYVDIKVLNDDLCSSSLGGRIELYKNNLVTLLNSGKADLSFACRLSAVTRIVRKTGKLWLN